MFNLLLFLAIYTPKIYFEYFCRIFVTASPACVIINTLTLYCDGIAGSLKLNIHEGSDQHSTLKPLCHVKGLNKHTTTALGRHRYQGGSLI